MATVLERPSRPLVDDVQDWLSLRGDAPLDRWQVYARLRDEAPVYVFGEQVFLSRYGDCLDVLRDHRNFQSGFDIESARYQTTLAALSPERRQKYQDVLEHQLRWLTSSNGAKHVALRTLATRVFSVRAIEDMRARIQREVDERLEELAPRDTIEIIEDFAYQLPLTIISEMLDIPEEVRESIHNSWQSMSQLVGNPAERIPDVIDRAHAGMVELEARLKHVFDLRRGQQTTDLLARLLAAHSEEAGAISEREIMGIVAQMVIAGHQTTQDTIGSALLELFNHRGQWEAIKVDPDLIPNAVEEVLRYRTPGQMVGRNAQVDFTIGDQAFPAGTRVTCLLGSANRDGAVFADPDRFDIFRDNARQHLAFSNGVHFCLGASLSRMEVGIFLRSFTARFPDAHLAADDVQWLPNSFLLGVEKLNVRLR